MNVTSRDIVQGLGRLGLRAGDYVIVHSSLKSFGRVESGAATVVDALLEVVGPSGLLMMPTYARTMDHNNDLLPLDVERATITTGLIPATFARHQAAHRGLHPMYGITFAGQEAQSLAGENERLIFPYGKEQMFHVLLRERGFMLLLGVGNDVNSAIHMLEELNDPPYLKEKKDASRLTVQEYFDLPLDRRREEYQKHITGPKRDFQRLDNLLTERGEMHLTQIGRARVALIPTLTIKQALDEAMRQDSWFLVVKEEHQQTNP